MPEYALSTNLYTFAQVELGFFGWPIEQGEGELVRNLLPGDLIVPKFAQSGTYWSNEPTDSIQRRYCEGLGLDYAAISNQYDAAIAGGDGAVPYLLRVTGPTTDRATPEGQIWATVPVEKVALARA